MSRPATRGGEGAPGPARAEQQGESPSYVANPDFDDPAAEASILGPAPGPMGPRSRPPRGLPPYLASLYETPLLTRDQEGYLFKKMNYLKYKLSLPPAPGDDGDREALRREVAVAREQIIRSNLRLVVALARRFVRRGDDLFDFISEGNVCLIRAVETFDYARGYRFSTYVTRAVINHFSRMLGRERLRRARFATGLAEPLEAVDERSVGIGERDSPWRDLEAISPMLDRLDDRERRIIIGRFGLEGGRRTLAQLGAELGLTKERVRQLEGRASAKMRALVDA